MEKYADTAAINRIVDRLTEYMEKYADTAAINRIVDRLTEYMDKNHPWDLEHRKNLLLQLVRSASTPEARSAASARYQKLIARSSDRSDQQIQRMAQAARSKRLAKPAKGNKESLQPFERYRNANYQRFQNFLTNERFLEAEEIIHNAQLLAHEKRDYFNVAMDWRGLAFAAQKSEAVKRTHACWRLAIQTAKKSGCAGLVEKIIDQAKDAGHHFREFE